MGKNETGRRRNLFLGLMMVLASFAYSIPVAAQEKGKGLEPAKIPEDWRKEVAGDKPFVIYVTAPIRDDQPAPNQIPKESPSSTVSLFATPGEYEPASFSVFAVKDLEKVKLRVSDLISDEDRNKVPSSAVDIKIVKWWYQAGRIWWVLERNEPTLTPELLLYDDEVVEVWEGKNKFKNWGNPKDAKTLQPVDIPKGFLKQFWITVHVPDDAKAGVYRGTIEVIPVNQPSQKVKLQLGVYPFKLAKSFLDYSFYYYTRLSHEWRFGHVWDEKQKKGHFYRDEKMLEYELRHLLAHGIDNPVCYQPILDERDKETRYGKVDLSLLEKYLQIRQKVGIVGKPLYCDFRIIKPDFDQYMDSTTFPEQKRRIKEVVNLARKYGNTDVYFYGIDEGDPSSYIPWLKMVHEAGGKTWVAVNRGVEVLKGVEGLLDLAVTFNEDVVKFVQSYGGKAYCYAKPQGGVEWPFTYRRMYGLGYLWRAGYDGACTYAWFAPFAGHRWDEFYKPCPRYRGHNMIYPTEDGVVDTIQEQGFREAVDDIRYLSTLLELIKEAKASKNKAHREASEEAEKWVNSLTGDYWRPDQLDDVRRDIARKIISLMRVIDQTKSKKAILAELK